MLSTLLEITGFASFLAGLFIVLGLGAALCGAGVVLMIVGYAVGEPE